MAFIQLTNGGEAIVDDSLFFILSQKLWRCTDTGYARCDQHKPYIRLHRLVWELVNGPIPEGMDIDHENTNRLDCRIENLRLATRSQNLANSPNRYKNQHGYRGVAIRRSGKYRGYVWKDYKQYWTTTVDTPEEAAQLRDNLAKELHGEFAVLNF